MKTQVLGKVIPSLKGEYLPNIQYEELDIVSYDGGSYICKKSTIDNNPLVEEYWQLIANKGETKQGIPEGGIVGQVLIKKSDVDYDVEWETLLNKDNIGVESFNGRTGEIIPQDGDYTADMVGAEPVGTANMILTEAKEYSNNIFIENKNYTDTKALENNTYIDTKSLENNNYTDEKFLEAKNYADSKLVDINQAIDNKLLDYTNSSDLNLLLDDKADKKQLIGLATETFVQDKINEASLNSGGQQVDLSIYQTKDKIGENSNLLTTDKNTIVGAINEIKTSIDEKIDGIDFDSYVKTEEVNILLEQKQNKIIGTQGQYVGFNENGEPVAITTEQIELRVSAKENNAIQLIEDGLFSDDKQKQLDYINVKLNPISRYQKYLNTELDYGVFEVTDMTINATRPVVFSYVVDGTMEISENGFIKLKSGKTYMFHINLYAVPYNVAIYLVDRSLNIINQKGTSANTSFIYKAEEDIEVSITTTNSQEIYTEWGYVNVQEINRNIIIDPLEYVNTTQGIEDMPVGNIISHLGITAPKHYLICDGSEYNIVDYPYLVQHIETNFGTTNYFGGDGLYTFCVPDLKEKFLKGSENSGIYEEAGLPNITADWKSEPSASPNGAVYITSEKGTLDAVSGGGSSDSRVHFDASLINPIYGKSETVTPSNISVLFCIKYEPTYYSIVKRETTQEDITLLEEKVELLTRENTLLQHEINSLEAIMEAINRRQAEKEEESKENVV